MRKSAKIITGVFGGLLLSAFALDAINSGRGFLPLLAGAVVCALYFIIAAGCIPRLIEGFYAYNDTRVRRTLPRSDRFAVAHPWVRIVVWMLISRIAMFVIAYIIERTANGYSGGLIDTLRTNWLRTDSPSYLGIAQNWYVTEGDPRFHIVFFPLYPILIKGASFIVGNYFASAMCVSTLCACVSAVFIYELFALDTDRKTALRAVKYMFILPAAFFYAAPMTESLFLLLTVMSMYFALKKHFVIACIIAALSAFTRSLGVLMAVPIAAEYIYWLCERKRNGEKLTKPVIAAVFTLLIIPVGTLAYLGVNYSVTGDAFTFMRYQREHWSQSFGMFYDTAEYQLEYMKNYIASGERSLVLGLSIPNLLCCAGSLLLMATGSKRMRPSYVLYFLAYYAVSTGVTWLLSAPRYLVACFPLALCITELTRKKWVDVFATLVLIALLICYMGMYVLGYPVY